MTQRDLINQYGIHPDHRLGQNFLVNQQSLKKITDAAELSEDLTVLEIGAGLGALTILLAQKCRRVVAVEVDQRIIPVLKDQLVPYSNVDLVQADALEIDLAELMGGDSYRVVANIPYYITSALIRKLLETPHPADRLILTIQREVAERIIAREGKMSLLSLSVMLYGIPDVVGRIPGSHFYPAPKVESAVLRVDVHEGIEVLRNEALAVFQLARAGFGQKRKKLRNSIASGLPISPDQCADMLASAGIDPDRRAETLSVEEWKQLAGTWMDLHSAVGLS